MNSRHIFLKLTLIFTLALVVPVAAFSQKTGSYSSVQQQQGTASQPGSQGNNGNNGAQLDPGVHEAPSGSGVSIDSNLRPGPPEPNFNTAPAGTAAPGTSEPPQTIHRASWGLFVVIGLVILIVVLLAWRSTRRSDIDRDRAA